MFFKPFHFGSIIFSNKLKIYTPFRRVDIFTNNYIKNGIKIFNFHKKDIIFILWFIFNILFRSPSKYPFVYYRLLYPLQDIVRYNSFIFSYLFKLYFPTFLSSRFCAKTRPNLSTCKVVLS